MNDENEFEVWSDFRNRGGDNQLLGSFHTLEAAKRYAEQELGRLPEDWEDTEYGCTVSWTEDWVCCNIWLSGAKT